MDFEPHSRQACWSTTPVHRSISHRGTAARFSIRALLSWPTLGCLCFLLSIAPASAQSSQATTSSNSKPPVTHHHHRHAKPTPAVVAPPPAPPPPTPPADQTPHPATVSYAKGILQVNADNSSLVQTLNQISQKTGLAIEGLNHDQRIYGQYGPGPLADTVTKLLDGAGYDYVIVGGNGKASARLILTQAGSGSSGASATPSPAPAPAPPSEEAEPEPQENPETYPNEPPQPKTPQEIFDELKKMHPQPPQPH